DILDFDEVLNPGRSVEVRVSDLDATADGCVGIDTSTLARGIWKNSGRSIYFRLRPHDRLIAVELRSVGVATPNPQNRPVVGIGRDGLSTAALGVGKETMLDPGLADVFEAPVAQTVHVLRDHRVLVRTVDPIRAGISPVAGECLNGECLESA